MKRVNMLISYSNFKLWDLFSKFQITYYHILFHFMNIKFQNKHNIPIWVTELGSTVLVY